MVHNCRAVTNRCDQINGFGSCGLQGGVGWTYSYSKTQQGTGAFTLYNLALLCINLYKSRFLCYWGINLLWKIFYKQRDNPARHKICRRKKHFKFSGASHIKVDAYASTHFQWPISYHSCLTPIPTKGKCLWLSFI